jgi:hypothetical protein
MKKSLLLFLVFLAGLMGLAFIGDLVISNNLKKSSMRMMVGWREICAGNLHYDLLITGGSRAWVQYDPLILDSVLHTNAYNLGIHASAVDRQVLKYNIYRKFNDKPKWIIQNIDLWTMNLPSHEKEQFFPYFYDSTFKEELFSCEHFNLLEKYIPIYRYIGYPEIVQKGLGFKSLYGEDVTLTKGYGNKDEPWQGQKLQGVTTYIPDTAKLRVFDQYLAKTKAEGIKVVFVYAPMYSKIMEKIEHFEEMCAMYEHFAKKYDIPVLDYTCDPISCDTSYFYDEAHLNKKGATLFSHKLANDLAAFVK